MNILQVSTYDCAGGAEKVAWDLFKTYQKRGHGSWLAVGRKNVRDPHVLEIPRLPQSVPWARLCWLLHGRLVRIGTRVRSVSRLCEWLRIMAQGIPEIERELGREDFNFSGTGQLLQLLPQRPDILHAHNLHKDYFDLRMLPKLSYQLPTVITLHDEWLLSGHCASTFTCDRWRTGCGSCPDLSIYPSIRRDATACNWKRKKGIYSRSRLYIATPSKWLMDRVEQSMLVAGIVEKRIIPNGVDISLFHPEDKQKAKAQLNLPQDIDIVLFVANQIRKNIFKDYATIHQAITIVSQKKQNRRLLFLALGEEAPEEYAGNAVIRFIPYQSDPAVVANYYQAADIYLHATKADSFSNTVLEARACGTPVIATSVGGIPEQIIDGVTGFLVAPGGSMEMSDKIAYLLNSPEARLRMGQAAAEDVKARFSLDQQASAYLDWYNDMVNRWPKRNA